MGTGSSEGTWLHCPQAEARMMWGRKDSASPNPGQGATGTGKVLWETSQPVSEPGYLIPREDLVRSRKPVASIPGSKSISPSSPGGARPALPPSVAFCDISRAVWLGTDRSSPPRRQRAAGGPARRGEQDRCASRWLSPCGKRAGCWEQSWVLGDAARAQIKGILIPG